MRIFMIIAMLCVFIGNAQAGLYRSVDSQGKVHYSDSPLPGTDDVEQLKLGAKPTPDTSLPYETQRAHKNFPVMLYVSPNCGAPCNEAQSFLNKRGIPFTEQSLDTAEKVETYRNKNGDLTVPALTIGDTRLKGFLESSWNMELDFAGYPKSAPYRPRPVQPAQ
ncbi:MAG: glutaredoxin family protein [Gammaproteobacteria bacterium]|nr:glutaredoxin family protein [Gammaproteobacteria bacterium]MBU1624563.1 glutaredoxin family protein [Gammaproteobacteria bacterium]MBU1982407.1 glutaredoxin family protein [Gammaproteobacteria bacterium]